MDKGKFFILEDGNVLVKDTISGFTPIYFSQYPDHAFYYEFYARTIGGNVLCGRWIAKSSINDEAEEKAKSKRRKIMNWMSRKKKGGTK